jgi:hypothetical protein
MTIDLTLAAEGGTAQADAEAGTALPVAEGIETVALKR